MVEAACFHPKRIFDVKQRKHHKKYHHGIDHKYCQLLTDANSLQTKHHHAGRKHIEDQPGHQFRQTQKRREDLCRAGNIGRQIGEHHQRHDYKEHAGDQILVFTCEQVLGEHLHDLGFATAFNGNIRDHKVDHHIGCKGHQQDQQCGYQAILLGKVRHSHNTAAHTVAGDDTSAFPYSQFCFLHLRFPPVFLWKDLTIPRQKIQVFWRFPNLLIAF